jgi:hypothetical protein
MPDEKSGKSGISGQSGISLEDVYRKIEEVTNQLQQRGGFPPPESEYWKLPAIPGLPPSYMNQYHPGELQRGTPQEQLDSLMQEYNKLPAIPGIPPEKMEQYRKGIRSEPEDIYDKILRLQDEIERLRTLIEKGQQAPTSTPSYIPPNR